MEVHDRFNALAEDPVARIIRFRAASRAFASRREQRDPVPAEAERLHGNVRQLRLTAGALRREILRLRNELELLRGAERFPSRPRPAAPAAHAAPAVRPEPSPPPRADLASAAPPTTRKAYAVDPIGKSTPARAEVPPAAAVTVTVTDYFYVTNLGTLLDMLA